MDVINNKNKRFSMEIQRLLLMDNSEIGKESTLGNQKQNATVYESRPKKNLLNSKNSSVNLKSNFDENNKNKNNNNDVFIYKEKK